MVTRVALHDRTGGNDVRAGSAAPWARYLLLAGLGSVLVLLGPGSWGPPAGVALLGSAALDAWVALPGASAR